MTIKFANNISTTLALGAGIAATSFDVASTTGFPVLGVGDYFYGTISNTLGAIEIVQVTSWTGTTVTCVRGAEGTPPAAWSTGDSFEIRVTAAGLTTVLNATEVVEEVQTATSGQTVFTLTTFMYVPGENTLSVYVDGVNQIVDLSYTETGTTTVMFISGLHLGALVKFTTLRTSGLTTSAAVVTYEPAGTGAVATTVQAKLRESVSVLDFGADPTGVADSYAAIIAAQTHLASIGGGTLYFPPGQYKVMAPIVMQPGITYQGPMKAGISSYNPNRSRIFSSTGNVFINSASTITEVCFRDLFIESEVGGGHVFDWSSAGIVAKIEMDGVALAQRNATKSIVYGQSAGGVFSIWMHDFEFVYAPTGLPAIWITSPTVNSVTIEKFWSTANGESAAGNPAVWVESSNASGAAFNVSIKQGVFELAGSGCVRLLSCSNSVIEDCTSYDLSIAPGYYAFSIDKGASGPASNAITLRRCRSMTGTVSFADLFINMSVVGQGNFLVEQCSFAYTHGVSDAGGGYVEVSGSSLGVVTLLAYTETNAGPTSNLAFKTTRPAGANFEFWNGYFGNNDGLLNITIDGVHSGSFTKNGTFNWGSAAVTSGGILFAGSHIYPGTPGSAQQSASGLLAGTGSPVGGPGNDGDFYFRADGGVGTSIYMKRAGVWVGII